MEKAGQSGVIAWAMVLPSALLRKLSLVFSWSSRQSGALNPKTEARRRSA
jgi:hypothetical protein